MDSYKISVKTSAVITMLYTFFLCTFFLVTSVALALDDVQDPKTNYLCYGVADFARQTPLGETVIMEDAYGAHEIKLARPRLVCLPASRAEVSACEGGKGCGMVPQGCHEDHPECFCFDTAEGGTACNDDFFCNKPLCDSSSDCGSGEVCITNTCCTSEDQGMCVPIQCTGNGPILGRSSGDMGVGTASGR